MGDKGRRGNEADMLKIPGLTLMKASLLGFPSWPPHLVLGQSLSEQGQEKDRMAWL